VAEKWTSRQWALLLVGSIGPLGWLPASGTIAVAVVGIPLFWWMSHWPWWLYVPVTIAFALASVWLHHVGDRILGEKDSRKLVWDELAGFMVAVAFVPFTWRLVLVAFFLERIIDIVKVPPAHWIEKRWPGGWGVVGDDLMAGLYTLIILHFLVRFAPAWCGLPLATGG
jgi:phosphatidylglycerophosphatase A